MYFCRVFVLLHTWFIFSVASSEGKNASKPLLTGLFWEVKPFIFTNKYGVIDGIIPHTFKRAKSLCLPPGSHRNVIEFNHRYQNREEFDEQIYQGIPFGHQPFQNVSRGEIFFAPLLNEIDPEWEEDNGYRSFVLMKTTEIAIIVPRNVIDLPNKILRGIASCEIIFFIAVPMAVLFSIIVWFIERLQNDNIELSFLRGTGTTFWWSVVSMTTVGYGDIVPRAPLGRFVALFWLFVGVMLGCVMTATMMDVVSGIGHLSVYGQKVAVLKNSYEEKVASRDYQADVVLCDSYEDVLELVRMNKVFAAMMNADVAAWYQDEIKSSDGKHPPLHIIEKKPANLYVRCMMNNIASEKLREVVRCMFNNQEEIYTYTREKFQRYCHIETLHIGSISELFRSNMAIRVLIGLVCLFVLCGLFYDLIIFLRSSNKLTDVLMILPEQLLGKQNGGVSGEVNNDERYMLQEKPRI